MARTPEREQRQPPPKRRVQHDRTVELLDCGCPRTYDHREITYTACGTKVCDKHRRFQHFCRVLKHRNPGHTLDP